MVMRGTAKALELVEEIATEFGVEESLLCSSEIGSRQHKYVNARRELCIRGRELKIGVQTLAAILDRDPSTISYHINPVTRAKKKITRRAGIKKPTRGEQDADVS